jgi:DNA-binding transcriptional regulator YhcF (GntR family)
MKEAGQRESEAVTPEHLFIAILRFERCIGAAILRDLGITLVDGKPATTLRVRIDEASADSIYEQIVVQITEWIATGALHPGDRIPTVRRLADDLDIAPGTVARAYGELERQGLVVTEGTRGTRVADRVAAPDPFLDRPGMLVGLLRPAAVAAFHLGATAPELRSAMEEAMKGIFDRREKTA